MNKLLLTVLVTTVIVGGGSFYGGMKYSQAKTSQRFVNLSPEQRQQLGANVGMFRDGRMGMGNFAVNFYVGEIISKDADSITLKLRDGSSKIVFYSGTTEVSKFVSGSANDLSIGKAISVNGKMNQDGSITAEVIQLRSNFTSPIPSPKNN